MKGVSYATIALISVVSIIILSAILYGVVNKENFDVDPAYTGVEREIWSSYQTIPDYTNYSYYTIHSLPWCNPLLSNTKICKERSPCDVEIPYEENKI